MTIHINLLPWREERREIQKKQFFWMIALSILLSLMIVCGIHSLIARQIKVQERINEAFKAEIKLLEKDIVQIKEYEKQKQILIEKLTTIQRLHQQQISMMLVFEEIAQCIPEGLYLTSMARIKNTLMIEGKAQSNNSLSHFMHLIKTSTVLKEPKLSLLEMNASQHLDKTEIGFQLTCNIG
jgi:type IV pilus assembly protein PilN